MATGAGGYRCASASGRGASIPLCPEGKGGLWRGTPSLPSAVPGRCLPGHAARCWRRPSVPRQGRQVPSRASCVLRPVPARGYPGPPEAELDAVLLSRWVPSPQRALGACAGPWRSPQDSVLAASWCPWISKITWNPLKLLWRLCEARGITPVSTPEHPARSWALARQEGGDPSPSPGQDPWRRSPWRASEQLAAPWQQSSTLRPSRLSQAAFPCLVLSGCAESRCCLGGFRSCLLRRERTDSLPGDAQGVDLHLGASAGKCSVNKEPLVKKTQK